MYAKVFRQIYDSTLAEDWRALVTFQQFLVLADADGVVDMTPGAIHRTTNIPQEIIDAGIERLQMPDAHSRSSTLAGRRIVLIDSDRSWGWQVVNYEYYRNLASRDDKKEKDRIRIAEKRSRNNDVAIGRVESPDVANVAHTEAEADTEAKNIYLDTARFMFSLIQKLNHKHKEPKFNDWATEIRLMVERDHRTLEDIRGLFEWANGDAFWRANILSPKTLRKQWDRLVIQKDNRRNDATRERVDNSAPERVRRANGIKR